MLQKLRPSTYTAWWDLHAWAGVIASLVAYVMFFFGGWTLFHGELLSWQETRGPVPSFAEVDRVLAAAVAEREVSPKSVRVFLPGPKSAAFSVSYTDPGGVRHYDYIERQGLIEPRSGVSDFFYSLHYLQPAGAPRWLYVVAGLVSSLLLLSIVTGALIHLRNLLPQFHQFRPRKSRQVLWSDAHKVIGTVGLPFVAVFAFTGAWLGLDDVLAPTLTKLVFHGDETRAAVAQFGPQAPRVPPAQVAGSRLALAELLALAEREPPPPGLRPEQVSHCRSVFLNHIGDRDATAEFRCGPIGVLLRQRDGSRVSAQQSPPTLLTRIGEIPYELHFAEFAGLPLRLLYALLTLAGCAAILTGNWLWLERRPPSAGNWLLQRLTLATAGGSLVATAAMLLASRFAISAAFEQRIFWGAWLAAGSACLVLPLAGNSWRACFALAGSLFFFTPLVGLAHAGVELWRAASLSNRIVDGSLLVLGLFCCAAARVRKPPGKPHAHPKLQQGGHVA